MKLILLSLILSAVVAFTAAVPIWEDTVSNNEIDDSTWAVHSRSKRSPRKAGSLEEADEEDSTENDPKRHHRRRSFPVADDSEEVIIVQAVPSHKKGRSSKSSGRSTLIVDPVPKKQGRSRASGRTIAVDPVPAVDPAPAPAVEVADDSIEIDVSQAAAAISKVLADGDEGDTVAETAAKADADVKAISEAITAAVSAKGDGDEDTDKGRYLVDVPGPYPYGVGAYPTTVTTYTSYPHTYPNTLVYG